MDSLTYLGLFAATLTTGAFVPQIVKNWRTKTTEDLSWGTFLTLTTGIALWLVYGVMRADPAMIFANVTALALNLVNLGQMLRYRGNRPIEARPGRVAGEAS
ncbi:MAG: SemiSWEET transporter [Planctomycetota bacterium]